MSPEKTKMQKPMIRTVLGIALMGVMSLGSATIITNEYSTLVASEPHASLWSAQLVAHLPCTPLIIAEEARVRGLFHFSLPTMFSAERQNFDGAGYTVRYLTQATPQAVASFYAQKMHPGCKMQTEDGALSYRNAQGAIVRITLARADDTGNTLVTYTQEGVVLGARTEETESATESTATAYTVPDETRFPLLQDGTEDFANEVTRMQNTLDQVTQITEELCPFPPSLENALTASEPLLTRIQQADNPEDIAPVLTDIEDVTETLIAYGLKLPALMEACKTTQNITAARTVQEFNFTSPEGYRRPPLMTEVPDIQLLP